MSEHAPHDGNTTGGAQVLPCPKCGAGSHMCNEKVSPRCRHCDDPLCGHSWRPLRATAQEPPVATIMFRNTVTARMLRTLCERGDMPSREFMSLYNTRREEKTKKARDFWHHFGRFLRSTTQHTAYGVGTAGQVRAFQIGREFVAPKTCTCPRCGMLQKPPEQALIKSHYDGVEFPKLPRTKCIRCAHQWYTKSYLRVTLVWRGPDPEGLVSALTDAELDDSFQQIEHQMLNPRASDDEDEYLRWVVFLKRESDRRAGKVAA